MSDSFEGDHLAFDSSFRKTKIQLPGQKNLSFGFRFFALLVSLSLFYKKDKLLRSQKNQCKVLTFFCFLFYYYFFPLTSRTSFLVKQSKNKQTVLRKILFLSMKKNKATVINFDEKSCESTRPPEKAKFKMEPVLGGLRGD